MTDWLSISVGVGGVAIGAIALYISWRWRSTDRSLLEETKVLVEAPGPAIEGIEDQVQGIKRAQTSNPSARGTPPALVVRQPTVVVERRRVGSTANAREIRRQQAQALKEQKFRWQQTKDLAKAVRWVLEKLDEDD